MTTRYLNAILTIGTSLEQGGIPYQFTGASALFAQGVEIKEYKNITVSVQWDLFHETYALFSAFSPTETERNPEQAAFQFGVDDILVKIGCLFNTTIKTDPYRVAVKKGEAALWCRSLYTYLYDREMAAYSDDIHTYLAKTQQGLTYRNEQAWNQNNYTALVNRYGNPDEIALKIKENPTWRLHPFFKYLGEVSGKKITHLMGSNGVKATALSLLGAYVRVVDFSKENAAFAMELAASAGVSIDYVISDVLSMPRNQIAGDNDIVLMELGVLHYLIDLGPLLEIVKQLLKSGGRFILHEFHPISTKLITSSGKKHKVTGNYFDPAIESHTVAFSKHMPDEEKQNLSTVMQRKWTIGELITAVGQSGLMIKVLEEEPNHKMNDIGLPKTYTLVAEKLI